MSGVIAFALCVFRAGAGLLILVQLSQWRRKS